MILSSMGGLKISSMEHLWLVGTNLEAEVANKSATTFCNLGIEFILKTLKCAIKFHT